jgi:hypothetical protein
MQTKFLEEVGTQWPTCGSADPRLAPLVLLLLRESRLSFAYCVGYVLLPHTEFVHAIFLQDIWKQNSAGLETGELNFIEL